MGTDCLDGCDTHIWVAICQVRKGNIGRHDKAESEDSASDSQDCPVQPLRDVLVTYAESKRTEKEVILVQALCQTSSNQCS